MNDTLKIEQPPRIFRMGSLELADPAPQLSAEEAVKIHAVNFPQLAAGTLNPPVLENGRLIFEVSKPVVKTNG